MKPINMYQEHEYNVLYGDNNRMNRKSKSADRKQVNYDRLSIRRPQGPRQKVPLLGDSLFCIKHSNSPATGAVEEGLTDDEKRAIRVDKSIGWLRSEVIAMKEQDKALMRQLLELRAQIHRLRGSAPNKSRSGSDLTSLTSNERSSFIISTGDHSTNSLSRQQSFPDRTVSMLSVASPGYDAPIAGYHSSRTECRSFDLLI